MGKFEGNFLKYLVKKSNSKNFNVETLKLNHSKIGRCKDILIKFQSDLTKIQSVTFFHK